MYTSFAPCRLFFTLDLVYSRLYRASAGVRQARPACFRTVRTPRPLGPLETLLSDRPLWAGRCVLNGRTPDIPILIDNLGGDGRMVMI